MNITANTAQSKVKTRINLTKFDELFKFIFCVGSHINITITSFDKNTSQLHYLKPL